ncbi:MAG: hypothetical protein A2Y52_09800 [Sulfuricurvum sp. RIFCSPLOWO2_02_43_6]|nr:MAG: hypothetical protein A2Y52_09800 [Sulfuricurvum sp. RIFCSPLOWO2_02_43_6]
MNPILDKLLPRKKILITCGSGGVGKTTIAAALAVQAAMEGKKAIVLTIDPAKRLANSLGLDQLADEPQEIKADMFPQKPPGSLSAMMVDTKRTFDRVVIKYSHSPDASRTILNNRLYQYMSNMLAGSQEYMAMEKLYEIAHDYEENEENAMNILNTIIETLGELEKILVTIQSLIEKKEEGALF